MTQKQLVDQLSLDLGISIKNRRPYAQEVFKHMDMDLLPRSSVDTLLGELYEWEGRLYRSKNQNLIGFLFSDAELKAMEKKLGAMVKVDAQVPVFEFTREHVLELGGAIPALFSIDLKGKINSTKELSIVVSDVTVVRLTNYQEPGISIHNALSKYAQGNSKGYRKNIKNDYVAEALFYAKSVELSLEKKAGQEVKLSFDANVKVEVEVDNSSTYKAKLSYKGNGAPFAAKMREGKKFLDRY